MRKNIKKIICCVLVCIVSFVGFVGCSGAYELKKQAKKLNNYHIQVDFDTTDMTANCNLKFDYKNTNSTIIDNLVFHLYPRAFRKGASVLPYSKVSKARCFPNGESYGDITINQVKENGANAKYSLVGCDEDKLQVDLNKHLDIDDTTSIEIFFDLALPNCTHRFGYYENNINLANFYPILAVRQNGEWDMTPYYSSGDPFYSVCSNYYVDIKVDNNYICYATGDEINKTTQNDKNVYSYQALAVRDFAMVLGDNFEEKKIQTDKLSVTYVGYKGDSDLEELSQLSSKAMTYFSKTFEKYPYSNIKIIKTPFLHGGMEYPGLVMIADTIKETEEKHKVIVHEIAHQWWYGLVGVNESTSAWIDEGLAEYSTALFFGNHAEYNITYNQMINDAITSYTLYVDVINSINGKIHTKMNLPVNEYINEYEYTYMVYVKGIILFDELSQIVSQQKLIKALSKISSSYKYKNISQDEFTEEIKRVTGKNTDGFINSFLEGNAVIGKLH